MSVLYMKKAYAGNTSLLLSILVGILASIVIWFFGDSFGYSEKRYRVEFIYLIWVILLVVGEYFYWENNKLNQDKYEKIVSSKWIKKSLVELNDTLERSVVFKREDQKSLKKKLVRGHFVMILLLLLILNALWQIKKKGILIIFYKVSDSRGGNVCVCPEPCYCNKVIFEIIFSVL